MQRCKPIVGTVFTFQRLTFHREDDFEANQSELKFLRIQLQALEAQCAQYIPHNEDPELTESILNWKVDWEDIDKRSKARRKKCKMSVTNLSDSQKVVDGS